MNSINQAAEDWGIKCLRYEIKDIHVPPRVKESMQMQARPFTQRPALHVSLGQRGRLTLGRDKEGGG